ncbi:MAG: hypothetical protein M1423_10760 [Acidobacteria bacterium]|nr:hypothetical protein [Acidobacteriota bacterium]
MCDQAIERVTERKLTPQANVAEKPGSGSAESDQIIAPIGTRPKDCIHRAQFFESQMKNRRRDRRGIRADDDRPRVLPQKQLEGICETFAKAPASLLHTPEMTGQQGRGNGAARDEQITDPVPLKLCDLVQGVGDECAVQLRRAFPAQGRDEPRLGFSGHRGAREDGECRKRTYSRWSGMG